MAEQGDLIDFNIIEGQKENIEALPSGRSAKALAQRFSPLSVASPSDTQDIHAATRRDFESELSKANESDDPLDIYDRYVRWTQDAYPSAAANGQSQLLPLLERATRAFLKDDSYKNDARYLKLWLTYIHLYADSPRETFAYIARHNIGGGLALFYEEFAAWLEERSKFEQAEEIYRLGLDKNARPSGRLQRKFGEFQQRAQARPLGAQRSSSPALPVVRQALAATVDPFSAAAATAPDPQAMDRAREQARGNGGTSKKKMQIFADAGESRNSALGNGASGLGSLGTFTERRKENVTSAQPMSGTKIGSGVPREAGLGKMAIFKDQSILSIPNASIPQDQGFRQSQTMSRAGRTEHVFVNLEAVYPNPHDPGEEYCFEELRAASRGWLQRDWRSQTLTSRDRPARPMMTATESTTTLIPLAGDNSSEDRKSIKRGTQQQLSLADENNPISPSLEQREAAKRFRREERANRTRKFKVKESRAETQTIQTNLDSPRGPKLKRKKSAEPTMTIHTKAATDEVYELFNQSISEDEEQSDEAESDASSSSSSDEDDGYTTGGESTGTGRISGTSEYGEETEREIEADHTEHTATAEVESTQDNTGWTDFTTSKHMPKEDEEDASVEEVARDDAVHNDTQKLLETEKDDLSVRHEAEELVTPISPQSQPCTTSHRFVPVPPEDFNAPTRPYRDASQVAANRLPFMTPIVEKTESSLGTATQSCKDYFTSKTPCPKTSRRTPVIAEDEDELWSSPFHADDVLQETTKFNAQVTARAQEPPIKSPPRPIFRPIARKDVEVFKGPIIKDAQCNPMSPDVHEIILREMQPSLSSFEGFFDQRASSSGRKADIRKYCKSVGSAKSRNGNDKTISTLTVPPILRLDGAEQHYAVKRELGAGAFAPVYLTETFSSSDADEENEVAVVGRGRYGPPRPSLQALKMEDPPSAWEFYMLRCAHRRLGVSRPVQSIIQAYEMHLFSDEGLLFEEYRDQGTLLDLVNAVAEHNRQNGTNSTGMDECLAMFFTIEILRTVEALHAKNIIHGDMKADNVLIRFEQPENDDDAFTQYRKDGSSGWSAKGITLIDFGRGIDMRHYTPDVQFIADWPTTETDCAEMRELRPWTYQADYHGIAAIAHTMLFGKYIETVAEKGGIGAGAAKSYRLKEGLKRWWQTEIWSEFFHCMLNSSRCTQSEEGQKLPVLKGLRSTREKMEAWLEVNSEKGVGLRNWIRKLEGVIGAKRKA